MQVTETSSDGLKRELKVTIPQGELSQRFSTRLDEVKDQVRDKLAKQRALSHIQERFDLVEEGRNAGKTLKEIADEQKLRFGFFLEALEYGTPPHGGIALGLDRIAAILGNENSIREVIAFPKTAAAVDTMSNAPSAVDQKQLRELHLQIRKQ